MVKFYDKVFVRIAGPQLTTIQKSVLMSSWTLLGSAKISQEVSFKTEADVTTAMGDGTDYVGSEKATAEIQIIDVNMNTFEDLRTNLLQNNVDIVIYDSNSPTRGLALWGVRLYPGLEIGSGKEVMLKLSGGKRYQSRLLVLSQIDLT